MKNKKIPPEFIKKCKSITAKRPKTVIDHILKYGFITTEELKETYGYNHPPRAARDVKEHGIPLDTFEVQGTGGRRIAAYRLGDPSDVRKLYGRTAFTKKLKEMLIEKHGCKCSIYLEEFSVGQLQIDHRIPFQVAGDPDGDNDNPEHYMLLCASANRAKSWSCEHCVNWNKLKKIEVCQTCYWAFPEKYDHIAMREIRRLDILWQGSEVKDYQQLKAAAEELGKELPDFVKEILRKNGNI